MVRVVKVRASENWRLCVEFSDSIRGEVSLADRLFGPVFEPLRDPELFNQAYVDDFGAVCWPNGADLAPDALHERLAGRSRDAREEAKAKL